MSLNSIDVILDEGAFEPVRGHATDAGLDLRSPIDATLYPHDGTVIDTGVHIFIPQGYVGILKSKSGLNVKHGLTNSGTIDALYTGSIVCKLYNNSNKMYQIKAGDKITQLVIIPIETPKLNFVTEFPQTERGDSGFGSTGR